MNELADLIRNQAAAMNMSAANAYDAGLNEGFRRGIARAAELVKQDAWDRRKEDGALHLETLSYQIRALKLKP